LLPLYYNVRSLWARRGSTAATAVGLSLVVFVLAAVLMLSHGIEAALRAGGRADNVVLLRSGATSEIVSAIERDVVRSVASLPAVASGPGGEPLAAGEVVVLVALPRPGGAFINATARGITAASFAARPSVRVVQGRAPRPGSYEIAIGTSLVGRTEGARVGGELRFAGARWPVVGRIEAARSAYASEIWADAERLAQAFRRTGPSSAIVRLRSPDLVEELIALVESDPRFALKAVREDRYWAEQASSIATFIRVLGLFVTAVFSGGAVLGAMITMYAQVAARTRELGTLRALGFRSRSVLGAVVVESALLGIAGGLLGAALAWSMRWVKIRTLNFQTFSEMQFGFAPTPGILAAAIGFGLGMGIAGGLLPAIRAARLPVLRAVRG
jgi:ABC-type antimicrobial peptide transport system permease subunit